MGEYSAGGGPASSFNVYFYTNRAGHLPGTGVAAFLNRPYTGTPPDFEIRWSPISIFPSSGTYWVSVQAVQDFNPNGQWFWHNRTIQTNAGAVWQNPGDGYGTGCITWNRKNACMPNQVWFSKSSASLKAPRRLQLPRRHRARARRRPQRQRLLRFYAFCTKTSTA